MTEHIEIKLIQDVAPAYTLSFYRDHGTISQGKISEKILNEDGSFKCFGAIAIDSANDCVVGCYLAQKQHLIANPSLKSVQSMDTLVAEKYRGKHLVEKMARHLYDNLQSQGYECVVGVPNHNIEQLRYVKLKWNESAQIFRFTLIIPSFFCRIASIVNHNAVAEVSSSDELSSTWKKRLSSVELMLITNALRKGAKLFINEKCLAVTVLKDGRLQLGIARFARDTKKHDRFSFLVGLLAANKTSMLVTYCTLYSKTCNLFGGIPVLRTKSLRFAGRFLGPMEKVSFGEKSFEYIEFDTWGHYC